MRELVVSLRPRQWAKNLFVFAGLVFGHQLSDITSVVRAIAAFGVFCALSSAVYLVSDIIDRPADRRHPLKARRPIASGTVSPRMAWTVALVLEISGLTFALFLDLKFGAIAFAYAVLMALYVGVLKHVVIVDVVAIGLGFVLRAWGGAAVIHVPVSRWLLIVTLFLEMFLSLTKRRAELVSLGDDAVAHRRVLEAYDFSNLLDLMIAVVAASTIVAYALYTVSPETIARFGHDTAAVHAAVPRVRHRPLSLARVSRPRRRRSIRAPAIRRPAARVGRALGGRRHGDHLPVTAARERSCARSSIDISSVDI